ncbi:hypothetical protein PR003_g10083 [Phytophthora rubi]|uniref:Uncharacterized protein n=1 Tax=Phytophthora rubi TaxID=129364 RepID=A0A6A3NL34_9STRA|nr:hypothetical protein PR001_g9694 [Phytophthora rubi]KAE9042317.1 hypothetical protein PR002_g3983 [Phytophthora rubi]KAE9341244.1 hypothetical protein PR003_g10083 [Phytophthora rubi]
MPTPSDSTDSSQSTEPQTKKRKPTYLVRKQEEEALRDEILQLQAQVAVLQSRGLPAGAAIAADPVLQAARAKRKVLTDVVRNQQLGVAAAQSLLMESSRTQSSHPLCTHIRLRRDWAARRATLLAIRDEKLKNAFDYAMARTQFAADGLDHEASEKFATDKGDVCFLGNVVVRFPGVQSLRQVYEALYFYLTNMEISISERLGHITVREDYDVLEGSAYNARLTSSDGNGVTTESNTIAFTQLFEKGDPRFGGEPCAIVAADSVDEDELYPYRPSERIRKDISGAIVLTASRQGKRSTAETATLTEADDGSELVVTMRRTGYLKLHRPEFPVSPFAQQELEAGIADWGTVMIKAMREILYAQI